MQLLWNRVGVPIVPRSIVGSGPQSGPMIHYWSFTVVNHRTPALRSLNGAGADRYDSYFLDARVPLDFPKVDVKV